MDAKTTATLESGGYDYNFMQQPLPDRLVCKICQYPCRGARMSVCCGHVYCESCLQRAATVDNTCPMCRKESSEFQTFPNKAIDREIKELCILCTNQLKGCKWQGELGNINSHLGKNDGCDFEEMTCSNECGKMIQRQYLTNHVETKCRRRKVNCQYCHDRGEHEFIGGQHKEKCPKLPIACPNKCEVGTVPREDMKAHRKKCKLESIKCINKCGKILKRMLLASHMETECSNRTVECLHCHTQGPHSQIKGQHHIRQCPKLPLACPNKCEVGTVPREDMEAHRKKCPLEMIQCEYHNVGCKVRMARKDKSSHDEEMIKHHLSLTRIDAIQTKEQLQSAISTISKLEGQLNLSQCGITTANAQSIGSITEAPKVPVILKVTNVMLLRNTKQGWVSPIFLDEQMRKLCLHVNVADYEARENPYLSVCLCEANDSDVAGKTTFEIKLLNQVANEDHCKRNDVCLNSSIFLFVGNHQYLKDDCLYFVVSHAPQIK